MITICYITHRKNNPFNWFWDGLKKQREQFRDIPMQLIVVDYWANERVIDLTNNLNIETLHITPLPSVWQGKYQITKQPHYAAANARNTGFVYAIHPYTAFCDDVSVLGSRWLESVIDAAKGGYVGLGAYQKVRNLKIENGFLVSCDVENLDSRWHSCPDNQMIKATGNQFYGCSFSMPLESALKVNGFDCMTDGIGYEDQHFGQRLQKIGSRFYYDKRMVTYESNDHVGSDTTMIRTDPVLGKERYAEVLKMFGMNRSIFKPDDNKDASHIIVETASQRNESPVWNFFNLRELRLKRERGEEITLADMNYKDRWWVNNALISEM